MVWPFKSTKRLSRDLSEVYEGELEITIEGVCTQRYVFDRDNLATHVALVQVFNGGDGLIIGDIRKSPWEVVSFDREAKKLVVRPIIGGIKFLPTMERK